MKKLGVILLNLGGPNSLEDVQPFLENLFSDPEIIDIPFGKIFRKPLARFISNRRSVVVQKKYAEIGGKSPIVDRTRKQARALEASLNAYYDGSVRCIVETGMRYWHPFTQAAIERLQEEKMQTVFLLPLYPHYSSTTTGSSFKEWRDIQRTMKTRFKTYSAYSYHVHPTYIQALNERIDAALKLFSTLDAPIHFLFSAHGTPMKLVERGDPYSKQIEATVDAVMKARNFDYSFHLSYQSKVGPARWLEPNTEQQTRELATSGVKRLLVIPVAFVSDHIETLHELDIELRALALDSGIMEFHVMPALNDSPLFIECLKEIITKKMDKRFADPSSIHIAST